MPLSAVSGSVSGMDQKTVSDNRTPEQPLVYCFLEPCVYGFFSGGKSVASGEDSIQALDLDWKRFVTEQTVDFMRQEICAVRDGGSDLPVTTNLMYDFEGLDYARMAPELDVISWDNYPTWHKADD